jgi:hypothetical protein
LKNANLIFIIKMFSKLDTKACRNSKMKIFKTDFFGDIGIVPTCLPSEPATAYFTIILQYYECSFQKKFPTRIIIWSVSTPRYLFVTFVPLQCRK